MNKDYFLRFESFTRLVGRGAIEKLFNAHFCVFGLGGVGSWAAEALARCGVGNITIVDFDNISIRNSNRQIHAVEGEFNKPKVLAMKERLIKINPQCNITPVHKFFTYSNADSILSARFDYVIDAIDSPSKKCLLAARCKILGLPLIITGASGGKFDPTMVKVSDLSEAYNDRLLQETRKKLRAKYDFPNAPQPMGIEAVFSIEPRRKPILEPDADTEHDEQTGECNLICDDKPGTAVFVTATFGFVAVSRAIGRFLGLL
ncbi:MAG: tRNA threonylcarbamoyladenosine dehydratase [Verrucomicrobiia bacterium]